MNTTIAYNTQKIKWKMTEKLVGSPQEHHNLIKNLNTNEIVSFI